MTINQLKDNSPYDYHIKEHEGIYYINKCRPYDEQSYYWAYSKDGDTWIIEYKGTMKCKINNLDSALNYIKEQNSHIKARICHN